MAKTKVVVEDIVNDAIIQGFNSGIQRFLQELDEDLKRDAVIQENGSEVPSQTISVTIKAQKLALHQNHPNPFNPSTTISFALPKKAQVHLSIYGLDGRLVKTLVNETLDQGYKEFTWVGTDSHGNPVSSGVYFYRLKAGKRVLTKKMVLLK